jgi:phage terminase small subunit
MSTRALSVKQLAFVSAYVGSANGNATEAARIAGYRGSAKTLGAIGDQNLEKLGIKSAIEAHRAKIEQTGIAHLQSRVDGYNERRNLLLQIVRERSQHEDYRDTPGGKTGLLVHTVKQIGGGLTAERVDEFAVDTGLLKELRELEKQAAQDLGQWSEKREVTGKNGGPIQIMPRVDLSQLTDDELEVYAQLTEKAGS